MIGKQGVLDIQCRIWVSTVILLNQRVLLLTETMFFISKVLHILLLWLTDVLLQIDNT